ncbi:MAG TPA: TauD/TfdA family dioxygenase [Gammaproteobacteria bacterium]
MSLSIFHAAGSAFDSDELQRMILEKGVVILRNGKCTRDDFIRFSERIGTDFVTIEEGAGRGRIGGGYSGRDMVDGIRSLFSVTGKGFGHGVPLHGELYFQQPDPPHLLWFYCQTPSHSGGETLFCDGEVLFAALPEAVQRRLLETELIYTRRLDTDVWPVHYGVSDPAEIEGLGNTEISVNEDGSITTHFRSPAIRLRRGKPVFINNLLPFALREMHSPDETRARVRLGSGTAIPAAEILQIENIAASLAESIAWRAGDIAIIDNTRVLHGRNPVNDSAREIYVRISNAAFISDFLRG